MKNVAVFASGFGSNFIKIHQNIEKGIIPAKLALFVSDQKDAPSVSYAINQKIPFYVFCAKDFTDKRVYELHILEHLRKQHVDLIILAGYMRIIGKTLLDAYPNKIINIHPSLLPMFKGKHAIERAWNAKEKKTGVTIHFVDEKIDHGKIILQQSIDINHSSIEELTDNIHKVEHDLYTKAICHVLEDLK
ncbi:MAG: phosphoribosylglycinamide formyltransferase [Acholeplasmataceae bacterium]|nr:phosphoribosylglycinamide formyltransferase [Acholeplasmataceae bacterium]